MPVLTRSKTAAAKNASSTPANTSADNDQGQGQILQGATGGSSSSTQQGQQLQMTPQTPSTSAAVAVPTPRKGRGRGKGGAGPVANPSPSPKVKVSKTKVKDASSASNGSGGGTANMNAFPGSSMGTDAGTAAVASGSSTPGPSITSRKSIDRVQSAAIPAAPPTAEEGDDDDPNNNKGASSVVPGDEPSELGQLPPDWLRLVKETTESLQLVKSFPVDVGSPEFKAISDLVAPLEVTYAVKVVNPDLWSRYSNAKRDLLKSKSEDLATLSKLGLTEVDYMQQAHSCLNYQQDPQLTPYSVNEALLLHCTRTLQNVYGIYDNGLDERLGGATGTRLGRGIYFADDPLKAIQYDGTGNTVMIFSVLLGDCLAVADNDNSFTWVREPGKDREQRRRYNDMTFDSITGAPASGGGYNEYVIFNRYQCYPLYALLYKKPAALPTTPTGAVPDTPTVAWRTLPGGTVPMPNPNPDMNWASFAVNIFSKMHSAGPTPPKENCQICTDDYEVFSVSPEQWKELRCGHRLCKGCHQSIEVVGTTISGSTHSSFKCPYCQDITGIAVGDCPTGTMTVQVIPPSCDGYPGYGSIEINYEISSGPHILNRTAYLPDNTEGNEVLSLLRIAWDRRLSFTIGNSVTTGARNVLVWNIHHKTAIGGGVQSHGYPDSGYMDRVRWELRAYGIGGQDDTNNNANAN